MGFFLVFGDGIRGLLCWSTFVVSDGGVVAGIGCMYFFEWEMIVCWKSTRFVQFDWERNMLMDLVFYLV